jgi:exodeoxyribonuclease V alpha subunit
MHAVVRTHSQNGEVVGDDLEAMSGIRHIYIQTLYTAEMGVAARLGAMQMLAPPALSWAPDEITATVIQRLAIKLSADQLDVVQGILQHRVAVITGGPGTGKTTLIRSLCTVFQAIAWPPPPVGPPGG